MLGRHRRGAHHHLGAVRAQQRHLLVAHLVGHHEDARVAALGGDDGETNPGVARRGLHDHTARLQQAVALGGVDHGDGGTILDAPTGVEQLDLGKQVARQMRADATKPDEWRVPDEVEQRIRDLHVPFGHGAGIFGLGRHRATLRPSSRRTQLSRRSAVQPISC